MQIDTTLKAIADPTRREILRLVSTRELPAGEIAQAFAMSRPSVSRHLGVLLRAELVTTRPEGTTRYYRTNQQAVVDLRRWFDDYWETSLPRLKALAERQEKRGRH